MERSGNFYKAIRLGYILISILIGCMAYNSLYEWQEIEALELGNKKIDELRKEINNINIQMIKFSLLGETILEWNDKDIEHYHARRMAMDSMLCRFKATYPAERIDSVRSLLEDKERQMFQIVRLMDEQQSINKKIANQIPVIVQKSVQEQSKKPKRKGFLGIFGKKKEVTPAVSTTILHSVNRNVISEQKVQDRQLSEQADSLAARNAELNRQLQELICQIEEKVQTELQSRENEIVAMREKSFMQVGGLMGFVLLLLLISYIIIHRDAKSIKQYKHKTTDLIRQLEQSVQRNEALITSRKKAVHTITHELRTPLTAITGYAGLIRKEQCEDKSGQYIQNILQSSDRMRDMLNTLLDFFRLDNGKEQPRLSPCRISAITHTLETEFMPVAVNKGLSLSVKTGHDAIVLTDKERIIQIGNNLLSNAVKFTEEGGVSLITEYDNGVLTLVVEDTGTGMTEEEQKQAFGAFERLSNAAAKEGFGLTYDWNINSYMHLKVEPYYQYLFRIPVEENSSFSIINHQSFYLDRILKNRGSGVNYGIDITLEQYMKNGFYYMITASLFKSKYKAGDNIWRNTRLDKNYLLNILAGKEWMVGRNKQNVLSLNGRIFFQGGDRYTPVDEGKSMIEHDIKFDETRAYSKKFDPSINGDISFSYRINKKKISHEFSIKMLNVGMRTGMHFYQYNEKTHKIEKKDGSGLIPNISYKIYF